MLEKSPLKTAGPSERAGFIDAPVNGPPTNEQIATTEPIDTPIIDLVALESVATPIIVNIKKKLINTSKLEPPTKLNLLIVKHCNLLFFREPLKSMPKIAGSKLQSNTVDLQ